jgi:hypothetical protein
MDRCQVEVVAAGGEHAPDLPRALLNGGARRALRDVVLGVAARGSNALRATTQQRAESRESRESREQSRVEQRAEQSRAERAESRERR